MLADLPADLLARYRALPNIGVVCVVHKLRRSVSPHFWTNINAADIEIPGIVEFSRLRPLADEHVVYLPYYMPQTHEKFSWTDERLVAETTAYLRLLNPSLTDADFLAARVGRLRYAQPICGPRFLDSLPPISSGIRGLQVADTSYYYPEDRGISESVRLARRMLKPPWGSRCDQVAGGDLGASPFHALFGRGRVCRCSEYHHPLSAQPHHELQRSDRPGLFGRHVDGFVLSKRLVFERSSLGTRTELIRFGLVNLAAIAQVWVVSVGLAEWLFPTLGIQSYRYDIAHIIGVAVPVVTSYLGHRHYSFARRNVRR